MLHRALQIETLKSVHKNGVQYTELKDSIIRTKDEEIYYPLSISKFEERLKQYGFFRIHKSFLININKVSKIESTFQSKLIFHFEGIKDKIKSSKEGGKHFRENFKP